MMRLDFGKKANRNEHAFATGIFVWFTIFCVGFYGYFGYGTMYVLTIEVGYAWMGFFFTGFETLFAIKAWSAFRKPV